MPPTMHKAKFRVKMTVEFETDATTDDVGTARLHLGRLALSALTFPNNAAFLTQIRAINFDTQVELVESVVLPHILVPGQHPNGVKKPR